MEEDDTVVVLEFVTMAMPSGGEVREIPCEEGQAVSESGHLVVVD